jgi:hypothetical protein
VAAVDGAGTEGSDVATDPVVMTDLPSDHDQMVVSCSMSDTVVAAKTDVTFSTSTMRLRSDCDPEAAWTKQKHC